MHPHPLFAAPLSDLEETFRLEEGEEESEERG